MEVQKVTGGGQQTERVGKVKGRGLGMEEGTGGNGQRSGTRQGIYM